MRGSRKLLRQTLETLGRYSACELAWTIGFVSCTAVNFENLIDKQFIGRFLYCTILNNYMLLNEIIKISTTYRNETRQELDGFSLAMKMPLNRHPRLCGGPPFLVFLSVV